MAEPVSTRGKATLIGFSAVLLWSLLAMLTIGSAPVPPLLLNAMCFGIGGALGLVWTTATGRLHLLTQVSWKVYAFGTAGLFGYHFLYFTAFRLGPDATTGLIAYLWPLFIVIFSGLLPQEKLTLQHILGALIALAGAAIVVLGAGKGGTTNLPALGLAFLCALTWATYSLLSRGLGKVPTESVTVFCLATAALSLVAHHWLERTIWPEGAMGWGAVILLGLGPVGLAFFTWDIGMKKGDIQLLGVTSYLAPLLSTLALVAAGMAEASFRLLAAAVLITGGAALAARASLETARPLKGD